MYVPDAYEYEYTTGEKRNVLMLANFLSSAREMACPTGSIRKQGTEGQVALLVLYLGPEQTCRQVKWPAQGPELELDS